MDLFLLIKENVHHHGPNAILLVAIGPYWHHDPVIGRPGLLGRRAKVAPDTLLVPAFVVRCRLELGKGRVTEDLLHVHELIVGIKDAPPGIIAHGLLGPDPQGHVCLVTLHIGGAILAQYTLIWGPFWQAGH